MSGVWKPKYPHRCAKCGWTGKRSTYPRACPKCNHWKPEQVEEA